MTATPPEPMPEPDPDARLRRLEEAAAFAEHSADQLSAEIAELNRLVRELHQRTEALEGRLTGVVEHLEREEPEET